MSNGKFKPPYASSNCTTFHVCAGAPATVQPHAPKPPRKPKPTPRPALQEMCYSESLTSAQQKLLENVKATSAESYAECASQINELLSIAQAIIRNQNYAPTSA